MAYDCITTLAALQRYLEGATLVAFDFETAPDEPYREVEKAALDAHKSHIVGISFSVASESAVYVPLTHRCGINADEPTAIWSWLQTAVFENTSMTKIAHNLSFEAMFLYARGILLQPPCYDTIAAAQLTLKSNYAFRGLSDSGLKTLVPTLLNTELPGFLEVTDGRSFDELDAQDAETVRYTCADSDFTLRLYHLMNDWFDRFLPKHRTIVEQVESPTAIYVGIMKYNGLLVDQERMREKQAEAEAKLQRLREDIAFMIGDINIGANASTAAFKKYLYDDLQLPVMKLTAKHQEAMDDEALILLKEWCAKNRPELVGLFTLVQEYRRWGKITSTYITGYMQHINAATGRIHPDLLPLATETGRFASRNPNMQNMPRAGNDDIGVRNFLIAPEGSVLLSLDMSQIELRVGALYCRDQRMLETYKTEGDIHALTTAVIYRIPLEQALDKHTPDYKERRTIAKNCNFGTFFGLFPKGLQRTLKFKAGLDASLVDCERIIERLKRGYPGLARWQEETRKQAGFRRYAETWLGRRRYLPGIASLDWGKKSFAERCALNTPIQGTAADILKLAMGRIVLGLRERPWLKPLLQIHDELVFEIPNDRLDEAVSFIKGCMEARPFEGCDIPIKAEAACGARFGELEEMEV
ncbi:bifunctional 3'-5' exonuclease/DNA polymerase [Eubacteriales bacterium OttesenSCG-928-A19]|nr:bifunctional 3'-5' exonuclease/DNA polymerase [Eubacteriales bacterium OttesenSCG-928-A19]